MLASSVQKYCAAISLRVEFHMWPVLSAYTVCTQMAIEERRTKCCPRNANLPFNHQPFFTMCLHKIRIYGFGTSAHGWCTDEPIPKNIYSNFNEITNSIRLQSNTFHMHRRHGASKNINVHFSYLLHICMTLAYERKNQLHKECIK